MMMLSEILLHHHLPFMNCSQTRRSKHQLYDFVSKCVLQIICDNFPSLPHHLGSP